MDESVKQHKKMKKYKSDQKQKKITSKVNTLDVTTKKEKADNSWPKPMSSTELYSSFNIPDILVTTHQKKESAKNKVAPPPQKRKFSGDKTSQDCDQILENHDYTEASEERRIRTKSLPQPPSHSAADGFTSAPLPVDNTPKKEDTTQGLLNERFSLATKNDYASVPLSFHTASKLGAKNLTKSIPTITLSEPISLDSYEPDMPRPPVQIVDHKYVNNSPRQILQQRSKSVTESPKTEFNCAEEEAGYLKNLYNSVKNKFSNKNKLPTHSKGINEEDVILHSHPQSQPQILSQVKQSVTLKQNANLQNKTNPESKHNIAQNQKKIAPDSKVKMTEGAPGQKFAKLPTQVCIKTNEKNTTPPQHDNTLKLPNQKLPPTTNLNKPESKLAINPQNNSELENLKIQLRQQQEQLNQLIIKQDKQQHIVTSYAQHNMASPENQAPTMGSYLYQHNMGQQNKPQSTGGSHLQSNKGTALKAILQLVEATEPRYAGHFTTNLAGANDELKQFIPNIYTYDQTDHG